MRSNAPAVHALPILRLFGIRSGGPHTLGESGRAAQPAGDGLMQVTRDDCAKSQEGSERHLGVSSAGAKRDRRRDGGGR